jgi:hypothetical protein
MISGGNEVPHGSIENYTTYGASGPGNSMITRHVLFGESIRCQGV